MDRSEQIRILEAEARGEIRDELFAIMEQKRDPGHMFPDDPDMEWDLVDSFEDIETKDIIQLDAKNKREWRRLARLLGYFRQVRENECILINGRRVKPGAWIEA